MADVHRIGALPIPFRSVAALLETSTCEILTGNKGMPAVMTTRILGTLVSREVVVDAEPFLEVENPLCSASVAFTIRDGERPEWFPVFSGDFEVTAVGSEAVELALEGRYAVPGGFVGRLADRGGLHFIADDSIDRFFTAIIERLRSGSRSDR